MPIGQRKPGAAGKSAVPLTVRLVTSAYAHKAGEFKLPGKASKENFEYPYHKPTQVDEESIQRRSDDGSFRN